MERVEEQRTEVESCLLCCENIRLTNGELSATYIGDGGIFVIARLPAVPEKLFLELRETLGTTRIQMYIPEHGFYEPLRGFYRECCDDDALGEQISNWVVRDIPVWDKARIEELASRLRRADGLSRGEYTDGDGNTYVLKNGSLHPASALSQECMFYCTLFGGVFGIHRFYSGKFFTGLMYLGTGGLFGVGWLLDLLQLFLGTQKDHTKHYFAPLRNPARKLLYIPFGIVSTVFLLFLHTVLSSAIADTFSAYLVSQMQQSAPSFAFQLKSSFENIIKTLTDIFGK